MDVRRISVSTRLAIAFASQVHFLLAIAAFGSYQMSQINANVPDLATNWLPNQLDEVTQPNAALVKQRAAAAKSLRQQAGVPAQAVRQFQVPQV